MERGCLVGPRTERMIRSLAHQTLDSLGMDGRPVEIMTLIETELLQIDRMFSFEILDADEMVEQFRMDALGMTVPSRHLIALRNDVYAGACRGEHRGRFTAAHELGHYLMHRNEDPAAREANFPRLPPDRLLRDYDSEWQADTFAREFLADIRYFNRFEGPRSAAEHFGVDVETAEQQWERLKKTVPLRDH